MVELEQRIIGITTDDPNEAFAELRQRRGTGEWSWDMADVRLMSDPPRTVHRWCVFRRISPNEE